jgi:hypothetical protein
MNSIKSWFAAQAIPSIRRGIGSRLAYAIVQRMKLRAHVARASYSRTAAGQAIGAMAA